MSAWVLKARYHNPSDVNYQRPSDSFGTIEETRNDPWSSSIMSTGMLKARDTIRSIFRLTHLFTPSIPYEKTSWSPIIFAYVCRNVESETSQSVACQDLPTFPPLLHTSEEKYIDPWISPLVSPRVLDQLVLTVRMSSYSLGWTHPLECGLFDQSSHDSPREK